MCLKYNSENMPQMNKRLTPQNTKLYGSPTDVDDSYSINIVKIIMILKTLNEEKFHNSNIIT